MTVSAAEHVAVKNDTRLLPLSGWRALVKRGLDVSGAAVSLLLASPLLFVIALLIKLQDGGPIIHRRHVTGPRGEFDAFKLRSMCVDADKVLERDPHLRAQFEENFKLQNDPRITPIGRLLRRLSLDELPQLINVLRGEMSLVGPRMVTPAELEKFGEARWVFDHMRPGITGYWQVYERRQVSYSKRVAMEVFYAENWSFLLDLKILMKTPFRVARGSGAY